MTRAPVVLGATAAGLVAVLSFHSRSGSVGLSTGTGKSAAPASSHTRSSTPTTTAPRSSTTTTTGTQPTSVTTSPPTTGSGVATARTAVGRMENYGYGRFKIEATVTAGRLTDVQVLTLQTAEPYSQQLAVQVLPMLRSQAEKVQSAKIYGISGATYTSEAYALSLQSALDKLHFH